MPESQTIMLYPSNQLYNACSFRSRRAKGKINKLKGNIVFYIIQYYE